MKHSQTKGSRARVHKLCEAALIAALYVALTYLAMALGLHNNAIQLRFSEALCALAFFTPVAIPGLTVGCLLANVLTGCAPLDILLGPVATLLGAVGAYLIGRMRAEGAARFLWHIPNVLANTVIVSAVCYICYTDASEQSLSIIPFYAVTIFLGEVISCSVLGTVLLVTAETRLRKILQ